MDLDDEELKATREDNGCMAKADEMFKAYFYITRLRSMHCL